jgi:hypothetical protein
MTREELLTLLLAEGTQPGPLPGVPYDSPTDQKARREALLSDLRAVDKYNSGQPRPPAVPRIVRRAQCANCGSPNLVAVRPQPRRPEVAA